jgi:isoleucyl-tRNA synthetase
MDFPEAEQKILKFWQKNKIFEKSVSQRKKRKRFVFFEGPPYANGLPGIHHLLARAFKDIILRYKTMQGFLVERRAGWDTQGLPTEIAAEKALGIKSKKDIEKLGIEKFIAECKRNVFTYKEEWERFTQRIGYWLDLKHPYITCSPDYIESLWWIIKKFWEKGFLKQAKKVVPWCPRCQTSLSSHEVAQGYKEIKEPAIYVKFPISNFQFPRSFLLVWTTTPWTLPGNVAVAVNPKFDYVLVKTDKEYFILAKERLNKVFAEKEYEIIKEFKGKDLVGLGYQPLYKISNPKSQTLKIYKVLSASFVSLDEGTGLVHIAPAFGAEDYQLIKSQGLMEENEFPLPVEEDGRIKKGIIGEGKFVKEGDEDIVEDLKKRNLLFKQELYTHDYPFCWRCESPLLYYLHSSWFVETTQVKDKLIKNNQKINWVPSYLKEGRFGKWLEDLKDWNFSRERYWGTPLPIWQCQKCNLVELIGGREDLRAKNFTTNRYFVMRHGEALTNAKGIISADSKKYPLTPRGKEEVRKTAKELKKENIDLIFSSPTFRARETAEIIGKELGITPQYAKELKEIEFGELEGKSISKYRNFFKSPEEKFYKAPKGGESWQDVKKRIYHFLRKIDAKYQNKKILLISHETPITLLEGATLGLKNEEILEYRKLRKIETGEVRELKFNLFPYNNEINLDFHRPYVDEIEFFCPKCGEKMKRVKEVCDVWFDSGSMPYAQWHYPFENKDFIDKKEFFPADFICEGIDQTRGWFYTLLIISTLLGFGIPYKNVLVIGIVLDEKGQKMSKSKGNIVDPFEISKKYGADAIRWYFYTINQPAQPKLFSEKDVQVSLRKFLMTFWNCYKFFETYGIKSSKLKTQNSKLQIKTQNVLDKWIVSRLNRLILEVTKSLESFDVVSAARNLENFVIEDLSLWYIRRSRSRFQKPKNKKELKESSSTLRYVLLTLSKLTAPFIPFLSEEIYQGLSEKESVHLEDWPKPNKKFINENLEKKMAKVREIVAQGLAERKLEKLLLKD